MLITRLKNLFFRLYLLKIGPQKRAEVMKKRLYHVGDNCLFYTTYFGTEPYLISIHNEVILAADVHFVTHDMSCITTSRYLKLEDRLDKVGTIEIFDNCFIGAYSIILPNVKIGPNSIVAAGSVVTKDIPPNSVYGGNPAKFICTLDEYAQKLQNYNESLPSFAHLSDTNNAEDKIKQIRIEHFWNSSKAFNQIS